MLVRTQLGFTALLVSACARSATPTSPAAQVVAEVPSPPASTPVTAPPVEWEKTLPNGSVLRAAAIDREGDLILAPTIPSTASFAGREQPAGLSLLKLAKDGSVRWSRALSDNTEAFVRAFEVTDDGRYVLAGTFASELTMGDTHLVSSGDRDAFVAMFSQNGELLWARSLGGVAREQAVTLALSDEAQVLSIGGWAESSFRFAGADLRARGTAKDGFVATFDYAGTPKWGHRIQGVDADQVRAIAYDHDELVVLGSFYMGLHFNGEKVESKGQEDIFCARYDLDGSLLWHRAWGSSEADIPVDLHITESGSARVLGVAGGDITIGKTDWPTIGESDILVWNMSASGEVETSRRYGGSGAEVPTDAEAGPSFAISGYYAGESQFAQEALPAATKERAFLVRLDGNLRVLEASDLDFDRLLFTKQRFGGELQVGLSRGRVRAHFRER